VALIGSYIEIVLMPYFFYLALYFVHGVLTAPQSKEWELMVGGIHYDLTTESVYFHYL
jgi:hypothetical protein